MKFLDHSDEAKEVLKQATIQWLFQACMLVEGQAVVLAAVHTSRLRNSIDYVVDEAELIGYVGTNVEYAIYVEMGTGEFAENGMGRKGGWVYQDPSGEWFFTWGQEPQPYLRPAFRKNKSQIEALAKEIFGGI
ncbi:HK97-gp10 family putative phage morphogenesis protein [Enterococcus gallinarum]|uniref:HK97-gp10 family putative phage morphogenesis protein n=1 Tax=Enterococcus gallinarum TaxID=1353 RepID=UPI00214B1A2D|nr:HK97-gp10 family putative phage morphogenesis protein [Enterococcus gallinarum]MCR1932834.1 HK97 gp10 family phage protein [Enterococcus gallinarum]